MLAGALVFCLAVPSFAFGWYNSGNGWMYEGTNGNYARKKWLKIGDDWYHFNKDGIMDANCWIEGKYYVGMDGVMLTNTVTPDGYQVGPDGAKIRNGANNYGAPVTAPGNPEKEGYLFAGWVDENGDPVTIPEYMPDTNPTYTALWEKEPARIDEAPTPQELIYTGTPQTLIGKGTSSGGTVLYALGELALLAQRYLGVDARAQVPAAVEIVFQMGVLAVPVLRYEFHEWAGERIVTIGHNVPPQKGEDADDGWNHKVAPGMMFPLGDYFYGDEAGFEDLSLKVNTPNAASGIAIYEIIRHPDTIAYGLVGLDHSFFTQALFEGLRWNGNDLEVKVPGGLSGGDGGSWQTVSLSDLQSLDPFVQP